MSSEQFELFNKLQFFHALNFQKSAELFTASDVPHRHHLILMYLLQTVHFLKFLGEFFHPALLALSIVSFASVDPDLLLFLFEVEGGEELAGRRLEGGDIDGDLLVG